MRPDSIEFLTGRLSDDLYPGGISLPGKGGKFTTDGTVQQWPGNTFICPLVPKSASYQALLEMQEKVKRSEFGCLFTFLPPPSFHMTVFQGMSPGNEGTQEWPVGLPVDAELEVGKALLMDRFSDVTLDNDFQVKAKNLFCTNSLTMCGVDKESEKVLRRNRKLLRDATGIVPDNFDAYVFHVTLSYLMHWVTEITARELVDFSDSLFAEFGSQFQPIELEACTFCEFETMHAFTPVSLGNG